MARRSGRGALLLAASDSEAVSHVHDAGNTTQGVVMTNRTMGDMAIMKLSGVVGDKASDEAIVGIGCCHLL